MERAFIYWDGSNVFAAAKDVAAEREGEGARERVRLHVRNLLDLARADRRVARALAAGSASPELCHAWNRMDNEGVEARPLERGRSSADRLLQAEMLRDGLDCSADPGIVVLVTGDGRGFSDGAEYRADLERLRGRGWRVEALSWRRSCARRMRDWVAAAGVFVALDDFYESVTFLEPSAAGRPVADPRFAIPVDLDRRPRVR